MKSRQSACRASRQRAAGFSLIEILVTLLIIAFGLLALAGFVIKSTTLTADTTQRARAAILLSDMSTRMISNKSRAAAYANATTVHGTVNGDCSGFTTPATIAARNLCEWNNLLVGSNDAQAGGNASQLGYRGCIKQPISAEPNYVITIAWGALTPGVPPADTCAQNAFGDEGLRRVLRSEVRIANLTAVAAALAPASAASTP